MRAEPDSSRWSRFHAIRSERAAERLKGVVRRTPLVTIDSPDSRVALRAKLENRQETGSFKARGAWNQLSQLTPAERERGVVACSSGNHGAAVAWAAHRAGVSAVIYMPDDAYANKIEACRALGAKVVLAPTRQEAEEGSRVEAAAGRTLVHPYDAVRTVEGAGTVGLEIAEDWPEVEVVVVPVGGGGLIAGTSLALRRRLGDAVVVLGAEPAGSPSLTLGLEAGEPVPVFENRTRVQGLCPLDSGALAISISQVCVDAVVLLEDDEIFAAQKRLVEGGERVEPAGAAAAALVLAGRLPAHLLATRSARDPLRVAVVVSGGNADPEQLLALLRTH